MNQTDLTELPVQPSELEDSQMLNERAPVALALPERPLLPLNGEHREQYPPEPADIATTGVSDAVEADELAVVQAVTRAPSPPAAPEVAPAPQSSPSAPVALLESLKPAPVVLDRLLNFAEPEPAAPRFRDADLATELLPPEVYSSQVRPAALEPATEVPLDGPSEPLFDLDQLAAAEPVVDNSPVAELPRSAADQVAAALAEDEASLMADAPAWTKVFDAPADTEWHAPAAPAEPAWPEPPAVSAAVAETFQAPMEPEAREPATAEPFEESPAADASRHSTYEPEVHAAHVEQAGYQPAPQARRRGVFARLFGGGHPVEDQQHGLVRYEQKPGLLRVFARRNYQREATLASMRAGFSDLSELMRDIRDGLHATVERQGELLESLRYLPVIAEQNQQSAQRLEEQSQAQAQLQVETVRALREQMQSQQVHQEQVGRVLSSISRESRDQKREIDELEGRMQRMREHDEAIASNLMSVSTAVRSVSEQGSAQNDLARRMQESFDERTRHLETVMRKQASRQGFAMLLTMLIAVAALGAAAVAGYLYLKQTGAI